MNWGEEGKFKLYWVIIILKINLAIYLCNFYYLVQILTWPSIFESPIQIKVHSLQLKLKGNERELYSA